MASHADPSPSTCARCGAPMDPGAAFCPRCGAAEAPTGADRQRGPALSAGLFAAMVCLAVALFFAFTGAQEADEVAANIAPSPTAVPATEPPAPTQAPPTQAPPTEAPAVAATATVAAPAPAPAAPAAPADDDEAPAVPFDFVQGEYRLIEGDRIQYQVDLVISADAPADLVAETLAATVRRGFDDSAAVDAVVVRAFRTADDVAAGEASVGLAAATRDGQGIAASPLLRPGDDDGAIHVRLAPTSATGATPQAEQEFSLPR